MLKVLCGAMALLSCIITILSKYVLHIVFDWFWLWYVLRCFCLLIFFWCPCIAITCNLSVQYNNGGFLPDIILLTQCYYHRGTRSNAIKRL